MLSAYLGLSSIQIPQVNIQVLHFVTFLLLTLAFYWIFDSTRRRVLNFTLLFVTLVLGVGSEGVQGLVTNRAYDPLYIAANILGSLCALGLCAIYHKRMLDRRRRAKGYGLVPQEGEDLEMGAQETGVTEGDNVGNAAPSTDADGEDGQDGRT